MKIINAFSRDKASEELLRNLREQWEFIRHARDHQDEQGLDLNAALVLCERARKLG